jgi:hypothetical protein
MARNGAMALRQHSDPPVGGHAVRLRCGARLPERECAVAKIDEFAVVLRYKTEPMRDRLEALKFLVHLVADVHQPLHASDDDDRGGNDIRVTFLGRQTNLHAVWDWGILFSAEIARAPPRRRLIRLPRWRGREATVGRRDGAFWRSSG